MCQPGGIIVAEELFLGHDLLAWLVLAFGGALVAGNVAAIVRPPQDAQDTDAASAATVRRRSSIYAAIGAVAAIWALATLLTN